MKFKEDEDDKAAAKLILRKSSPLEDKENIKPETSISNIYPKTPNGPDRPDSSAEKSPFFDAILSGRKMEISNFNFNSRYLHSSDKKESLIDSANQIEEKLCSGSGKHGVIKKMQEARIQPSIDMSLKVPAKNQQIMN